MIAPILGKVGQAVRFEGYADDYGNQIVALEFSLDGGKTWAVQDTSSSNEDLMISWSYTYVPQKPGIYQLKVRSVTEDGRKSPLSAVTELHVEA